MSVWVVFLIYKWSLKDTKTLKNWKNNFDKRFWDEVLCFRVIMHTNSFIVLHGLHIGTARFQDLIS